MGGSGRDVNAHGTGGSHGGVVQGRSNVIKKREDRERQKALKRPSSEEPLDEEERDRKKGRFVEDFDDNDATSPRDNREKKRKKKKQRKRPIPVIVAGGGETSQRSEHNVMGSGLHSSSETLVKVNGMKDEDDSDDKAPTYSSSDKGKGKAKPDSPKSLSLETSNLDNHNPGSGSNPGSDTRSTTLEGPDQFSEIARLKEQLAEQSKLLEKHQSHLNQQQQALTCQICLELLHKPYALIPCGHVTCYGCLIRWFTSDLNVEEDEQQQATETDHSNGNDLSALMNSAAAKRGTFVRRRKTCPVCRGVVPDRPVEMWDIKQMVAALVKSNLVDFPVPPRGEEGEGCNTTRERRENNTPNDPWRNIFRPGGLGRGHHRHGGPPPRGHEDNEDEREQFGWYDHEDGGVYRCVDCLHELWGGMCTGCERIYRGHETEEDDDDDDDNDDLFSNDDDGDMDPLQWAGYMFLRDEFRRRLDDMYESGGEEVEDEEVGLDVVDEYNRDFFQDVLHLVDEVEGGWSDGERGIDVESSDGFIDDGFIDDEERMRSGGLSGVGVVYSEEEASGGSVGWRGRLHVRNILEDEEGSSEPVSWRERSRTRDVFEEEGSSGSDGSDVGIDYGNGWDGSIDEETRRSLTRGLWRSTRRRTRPVVESASSDDGSEERLTPPPPPRRNPRLSRRRAVVDSENGFSSAADDESTHSDVELFQMRNGLLFRRERDA